MEDFSLRQSCAPFVTLLAAFQALLARYTGATDILVGTTVTRRPRPELDGIVGKFDNTLVLRADVSGDPTFRELLARVNRATQDALTHSMLPFERGA